jgi:integrase/recombinase XerD
MKPSEYLKEFELKLRCQTNSEATVKNYLSALTSFFSFCSGKFGDPSYLLKNYIAWGLKSNSPRTVNLHRAAIVKFFLIVKGIKITTQEVPRKFEPKQLPKIIDREILIQAIHKTNNLKHRLELSLMFCCGLRLSELVFLRRKNIITSSIPWRLWLENTKGGRHRIIPIPESVRGFLEDFVGSMTGNEFVFKGEGEVGHISKKSIENVVAAAGNRVGLKIHPHVLRHSFATEQIISGQNVFKVQQWMGHGSLKSTIPYVHLSEKVLGESTDLMTSGNYTKVF